MVARVIIIRELLFRYSVPVPSPLSRALVLLCSRVRVRLAVEFRSGDGTRDGYGRLRVWSLEGQGREASARGGGTLDVDVES